MSEVKHVNVYTREDGTLAVEFPREQALEELVQAMWETHVRSKRKPTAYGWVAIQEQAEELGIELVWS